MDRAAAAELANISTRGVVQTGENVMIGGFIVAGNSTVVVRAIGPSLAVAGVKVVLENPTLELHDGNGNAISSNDDWKDGPDEQEISDLGLAPSDDSESALLAALTPGAYTAVESGKSNATGVGLVEVYNLQ